METVITRLLSHYKFILPMNPKDVFQSFIRTFLDREINVIQYGNNIRHLFISEIYPQGMVKVEIILNDRLTDYQYDFSFDGNWDYQDRVNIKGLYQRFDRDNKIEVIRGFQLWFEMIGFVLPN